MKILIIEDDEFKQRKLEDATRDIVDDADIELSKSVNSGLSKLVEGSFDLVLLDMSLTTFEVGPNEIGGRPQNFGGIEVLRNMDRLELRTPVIVITQHERFKVGGEEKLLNDLYTELKEDHDDNFLDLVYYNSANDEWRRRLKHVIREFSRRR